MPRARSDLGRTVLRRTACASEARRQPGIRGPRPEALSAAPAGNPRRRQTYDRHARAGSSLGRGADGGAGARSVHGVRGGLRHLARVSGLAAARGAAERARPARADGRRHGADGHRSGLFAVGAPLGRSHQSGVHPHLPAARSGARARCRAVRGRAVRGRPGWRPRRRGRARRRLRGAARRRGRHPARTGRRRRRVRLRARDLVRAGAARADARALAAARSPHGALRGRDPLPLHHVRSAVLGDEHEPGPDAGVGRRGRRVAGPLDLLPGAARRHAARVRGPRGPRPPRARTADRLRQAGPHLPVHLLRGRIVPPPVTPVRTS